MTPLERRQWAVEQAVASFGTKGCPTDWNMEQRVGLFLGMIEPVPHSGPKAAQDAKQEAGE